MSNEDNYVGLDVIDVFPKDGVGGSDFAETLAPPTVAQLQFSESVSPSAITKRGDNLTYSFTVTNTGTVRVRELVVDEYSFEGSGTLQGKATCDKTTLDPGESASCSAPYTASAADVRWVEQHPTLEHVGVARGVTDPDGNAATNDGGPIESNRDNALVAGAVVRPSAPVLALDKAADKTTANNGDTVTYTFTVANQGTEQVNSLSISETAFTGSGTLSAVTCDRTSIPASGSATCTANYTVTAADAAAGSVKNEAKAYAVWDHDDDPDTAEVTIGSNTDDAEVKINAIVETPKVPDPPATPDTPADPDSQDPTQGAPEQTEVEDPEESEEEGIGDPGVPDLPATGAAGIAVAELALLGVLTLGVGLVIRKRKS
jgi:hypothetical protein